jgi:hypothetical protein
METSELIRGMRDALVGGGRVDLLKAADERLGDDDRDCGIAEIDPACAGLRFEEPYRRACMCQSNRER